MKASFYLTLLAVSSIYANPFQGSYQEEKGHKFYLSNDRLEFGEDGITYHLNSRSIHLSEIHHDEKGYFGIFSFFKPKVMYTATCNNCKTEYISREPQPCDVCELSAGFSYSEVQDIIFDD